MVALQVPLSTEFSSQEYWSGLPCPPPGDRPNPGIEPASLISPVLAGGASYLNSVLLVPGRNWDPAAQLWGSSCPYGGSSCLLDHPTISCYSRSLALNSSHKIRALTLCVALDGFSFLSEQKVGPIQTLSIGASSSSVSVCLSRSFEIIFWSYLYCRISSTFPDLCHHVHPLFSQMTIARIPWHP